MILRKSNDRDVDGIVNVLLESGLAKSKDAGKNMLIGETARGHKYIVAEENKVIVGIVNWLIHGRYEHELAELYHIGVLTKAQGKGVAQALFWKLVYDANNTYQKKGKQLRKLYLLTHDNNTQAHKLYEKLGMVHEATLKDHFHKGMDERVYAMFFKEGDSRLETIVNVNYPALKCEACNYA